MARALLLTAPWRRALVALRHRPGMLATAAAAGLIIGLVASAPVLFVSAVGSGAVQVQYADTCPASTSVTMTVPRGVVVNGVFQPYDDSSALRLLGDVTAGQASFAAPEHVEASYSPTKVSAGDADGQIGFLVRPGWRDHVEFVTDEVPGNVWLPDTLAAGLSVGPGDTFVVHTRGGGDRTLRVAAVFRDLALRQLDDFWCAAVDAILPRNMFGEVFPPAMAIVEKATFDDEALRDSLYFSRYVAQFARPPLTIADATRYKNETAVVRSRVAAADPAARVIASIDRLDNRSRTVRTAVRDTTLPVAALAVVCALALASVLGLLWVRARRNSCIALATIGVPPSAIGGKAALEVGGALVVGAAAGVMTAQTSMGLWAPSSDLEPGSLGWAFVAGGAAAAAGIMLVAATAAVSCRSLLRHAVPLGRGWLSLVPWELGLAVVAWLAARDIGTEALVPVEGSRVVDTSASVLLLPLAVLALGAALTARAWWLLTRRRRAQHLPTRLQRRLALRRLQFGSKAGTAILGAGTLALGVSVFGLAMNSSLERTGVAKSSVYVGSDIRVLIAGSLPADVPGATEVWQRSEMEYAGVEVDLLAVDPASFAQAAFWDDAFADASLASLMSDIATGSGSPVPAILVGDAAESGGVVNPNQPADPWPVEVVAHVRAFPGAGSKRPTLVVPLAAAQAGPINYFHFVFAKGDYGEWRGTLQELGAQPMLAISRQGAVDSSVLQFAAWSFDFVKALGVFVGGLVVAALVLHLSARQRQQALGFAFLRRMGFTRRRHWSALVAEVGAMMLGVVLLGTALARVREDRQPPCRSAAGDSTHAADGGAVDRPRRDLGCGRRGGVARHRVRPARRWPCRCRGGVARWIVRRRCSWAATSMCRTAPSTVRCRRSSTCRWRCTRARWWYSPALRARARAASCACSASSTAPPVDRCHSPVATCSRSAIAAAVACAVPISPMCTSGR